MKKDKIYVEKRWEDDVDRRGFGRRESSDILRQYHGIFVESEQSSPYNDCLQSGRQRFSSLQGHEIFLFSIRSRLDLGSTESPIQQEQEAYQQR